MPAISTVTYHRMSHVTGPGCVLVSLRFGKMADDGPRVMIRTTRGAAMDPKMDLDAYVAEVLDGVREANRELGSAVEVEEIEVIPGDFPTAGQVRHCAKTLARYHAEGGIE